MVYWAKWVVLWTGKEYSESTGSKISYPGELSLVYQERSTFHDSGRHEFLYAKIYTVLLRSKYIGNINDILDVANHCQGKLGSHPFNTQLVQTYISKPRGT